MRQRAILQLLLIAIGVAFEHIRMGQGLREWFFLINVLEVKESDFFGIKEFYRQYIYYTCEHIKFIGICVMMWRGPKPEDFKTDRFFVILAVMDFVDYVLWGNNLWIYKEIIPHGNGFGLLALLSMNLVSVVCFGIYAHLQWKISNGNQ